jgi:hypothetical protein
MERERTDGAEGAKAVILRSYPEHRKRVRVRAIASVETSTECLRKPRRIGLSAHPPLERRSPFASIRVGSLLPSGCPASIE